MNETPKIFGMAILVTSKNLSSLRIVNGGVKMKKSFVSKGPYYFVFPYDADQTVDVMLASTFHRYFRFAEPEDPKKFVDVIQIA